MLSLKKENRGYFNLFYFRPVAPMYASQSVAYSAAANETQAKLYERTEKKHRKIYQPFSGTWTL